MVNAGTLQLNGSLASTIVRIGFGNSSATLNLGASNLLPSTTQIAVDGQGSATFNLNGFNQTIATLVVASNNGGTKAVISGSGSKLTLTNGIITSNHNNGAGGNISVTTLDLNGGIQNFIIGTHTTQTGTFADLLISSVIQNGGINIVGTSTTAAFATNCAVTLTGVNTYSGATTITAGKLCIGNQLALQNSPLVTTTGTAILGVAPNANTAIVAPTTGSYTFGGLIGCRNHFTLITTNATSLNNLILNPGLGQSYSYTGAIANGAAGMTLTKNGAGTQILSNANTYTGGTNVNVGTLLLSGAFTMPWTGTLAVNAGG
ncbi:MAG: autotransporter-associated beta strand repeat-containing protein [Chthoniobacter sp.]|nr:autotransporter-associated beta strand repeat-containing protein [Chthoniobacter sp.]